WVMWLVVHIFYLIGFRNRLLVMLQWAWAYMTNQRSARLITCEQACAAPAFMECQDTSPGREERRVPVCAGDYSRNG
ncbi:MAG TPA: hypothetical protein VFA10_27960, partial [Ktedonobacteraceae bacterium]|nr:hypothetical protein [Ktedonobacteraceae bacterium]